MALFVTASATANQLKSLGASRRLHQNGDKSAWLFGSNRKTNLQLALANQDFFWPIGSDVSQLHSLVRDLGV